MIAASVDTAEFAQVLPDDHFNVDAPNASPLIVAPSFDVTRSEDKLDVYVSEKDEIVKMPSVERALGEVIARCRRDLEVHPSSPRMMLNLALALMNAGHSEEAVEMLRQVVLLEPKNYAALTTLGSLFLNQGQLESAINAYKIVHETYPKDPAPLISLASIALRNQDFITSAEYLEKAVVLDACSVMAKYLLAMICLRLGKHNRAISLLRTTLREDGPSAELNQGLAIAYWVAGDLRRAERAFLTSLAINRRMSSAVHGLAILRLQERRWDEAIQTLRDHLDNEPNDLEAREFLARAYVEVGQFSRARGQLMTLLSAIQGSKETHVKLASTCNNLGFCFGKEGKLSEAEHWLRRSLELDGGIIAAPYSNLTRVLLEQNRPHDALVTVLQAEQRGLGNSDLSLLHSVALIDLRRQEEAIVVLQQLVNTGRAPSGAYSDLGCLLAEWIGDFDAAVAVLREGIRKDPAHVMLLNNLAYVYLMQGNTDLARSVLEQIDQKNADPIIISATRGLLKLKEGDIAGGENLYREAESMASKRGLRKLAISIRQKRCLEVARSYFGVGREAEAIKYLQLGAKAVGGMNFYPFERQLLAMARTLTSESGIVA